MVPGLGCKSLRKLMDIVPQAEDVFTLSHNELKELFGNHEGVISAIENRSTMERAEEEVRFMEKYGIEALFCTDEEYPQRLNRAGAEDTPPLLYRKGICDLNRAKTVGIVGTRRATPYGKDMAEKIVAEIKRDGLLIVSGLAYGIDTASHTAAVKYDIPTAGVLGHGLDQLYPSANRNLAAKMLDAGGCLLTEYRSGTGIAATNFPARNRIIAAMCDAVIVVEASEKGGALITANMANGYHRDVFAVPGRCGDTYSRGCINLIANNKATIYSTAEDFAYDMGWSDQRIAAKQTELFVELDATEQAVADLLKEDGMLTIDEIVAKTGYALPKIAATMLNLELKNVIRCLPGKLYKIV